jgi:hypothetical protein
MSELEMRILNIHQKNYHARMIGLAKKGFEREKYTGPEQV